MLIFSIETLSLQEAMLPVWLLALLTLFGASLTTITIAYVKKQLSGHKIAVFGMEQAGKTQMLANMRNMKYDTYIATLGKNNYGKFTLKLDKRTVEISGGVDIGGGNENLKFFGKQLIDDNEIIFYLFNAYRYLNEPKYRDGTQDQLDFIYAQIGEKSKEIVVFATYADKFKSGAERKQAYQDILESVSTKEYKQLFKNCFILINMQDRKELLNILNTHLFKK